MGIAKSSQMSLTADQGEHHCGHEFLIKIQLVDTAARIVWHTDVVRATNIVPEYASNTQFSI